MPYMRSLEIHAAVKEASITNLVGFSQQSCRLCGGDGFLCRSNGQVSGSSRCLELGGFTIVTREMLHRSCAAMSKFQPTIEFSEGTVLDQSQQTEKFTP
jgi:hypothetical protein